MRGSQLHATEDVLCLADAELNSELGRVATEARSLIRVRRAIITSTDWLTHADLGSLVAAFIEADAVIAYPEPPYYNFCIT